MERWQPREAVQQAVRAWGWQVERIKIDDGRHQIWGTDAQGVGINAKIDPATLKVVEMKRRDRDGHDGRRGGDDDDDDDDGDRRNRWSQPDARPAAPGPSPGAALPPPGGLLRNGAPPTATVK